ncbi:hypothetical protein BRPE64_ACDS15070 [Caballeronia insecticola]|uniref:Uncharacterized protein n=1 Tax=Caballeronia insecticola TaxID=758793 RepID=R4WWF0_9BURK|nr:hypothetical protein BRPE64_ACDS15070 [Caballeronia insecticola]
MIRAATAFTSPSRAAPPQMRDANTTLQRAVTISDSRDELYVTDPTRH